MIELRTAGTDPAHEDCARLSIGLFAARNVEEVDPEYGDVLSVAEYVFCLDHDTMFSGTRGYGA